jgi:hypothetical protein
VPASFVVLLTIFIPDYEVVSLPTYRVPAPAYLTVQDKGSGVETLELI